VNKRQENYHERKRQVGRCASAVAAQLTLL
jgi:hypothetical protein